MSDKVAYPVGNTAGRDHLTGYTLLRTEILQYLGAQAVTDADELWPVDVTLLQAMAIAWRVKKWKLTGTCDIEETMTEPGPFVFHAIGDATIDADVVLKAAPDGHIATRENEIVGHAPGPPFNPLGNFGTSSIAGQPFSTWSTTRDGDGAISGVRNTGAGQTGFGISASATLFDPGTGIFAPNFSGPDKIIGATPIGSEAFFASAFPNRNPVTLLSGTGTGNLLAPGTLNVIPHVASDFVVPMQLSWRFTGQSASAVFSGAGSLELTLEAMEFWPFENSEGLPIYDSTSGAQLRSPFS